MLEEVFEKVVDVLLGQKTLDFVLVLQFLLLIHLSYIYKQYIVYLIDHSCHPLPKQPHQPLPTAWHQQQLPILLAQRPLIPFFQQLLQFESIVECFKRERLRSQLEMTLPDHCCSQLPQYLLNSAQLQQKQMFQPVGKEQSQQIPQQLLRQHCLQLLSIIVFIII